MRLHINRPQQIITVNTLYIYIHIHTHDIIGKNMKILFARKVEGNGRGVILFTIEEEPLTSSIDILSKTDKIYGTISPFSFLVLFFSHVHGNNITIYRILCK